MKTLLLKNIPLIMIMLIAVGCDKEEDDKPIESQGDETNAESVIYYDSTICDIHVYTNMGNVTKVEIFKNDSLKEEILIDYMDSVTIKRHKKDNVLVEKNIFYYNGNQYATHSIDSIFSTSHYYETYYTQNNQGYITKDTFSLGHEYRTKKIEYSTWWSNTVIIAMSGYPANSYTQGPHYIYSDLEMEFDLFNFLNNIKGKANFNLPEKYGRRSLMREQYFIEEIRYDYKLNGNRVMERGDYIIKGDTINTKVINRYTYF